MPQHPPFSLFLLSPPSLFSSLTAPSPFFCYCWWNIFLLAPSSSFSNTSHIFFKPSSFVHQRAFDYFHPHIGVVPPRWNTNTFSYFIGTGWIETTWPFIDALWMSVQAKVFGDDVCPLSPSNMSLPLHLNPAIAHIYFMSLMWVTPVYPCMAAISEAQSNSCVWSLPLAWFMGRCDARLSEGLPLSCYSSQLST